MPQPSSPMHSNLEVLDVSFQINHIFAKHLTRVPVQLASD